MANVETLVLASPEAEQSVLGGLMLDAQAWRRVAGNLSEEDFTRTQHRLIFRAIAALAVAGQAVDILTVQNWLKDCHQLDNAGGLAYLASIANSTPSAANIEAYAGIVREHAERRRRLASLDAERKEILNGGHGKPAEPAGLPVFRKLSDVEARPIHWLWPGKIARGKVTMLAGNPGLGKSQVTASLAAIVTTGRQWPVDRVHCGPGSVVFLSAEDDAADTIKPRLVAAGADVTRVFVLDAVRDGFSADGIQLSRHFNLKTDLLKLGAMLETISDVAMIVIDPVTAYLGETDSHRNAEVRALLAPLGELAARYSAAVVCVSHLNKGGNSEALMRVTGSLAFVAAARAAFVVARDPEDSDRRLFLPLKNNIGKDESGLAFRVESRQLPGGIETSCIAWEVEAVTVTADEALLPDGSADQRSERQEAADWLREMLADGPQSAKDLQRYAKEVGIAWATVRRAKDALGIKPAKTRFDGGWEWALPSKVLKGAQDAQQKKVSTFEQNEHLREAEDERAAIVEFDGGMSRDDAEHLAKGRE